MRWVQRGWVDPMRYPPKTQRISAVRYLHRFASVPVRLSWSATPPGLLLVASLCVGLGSLSTGCGGGSSQDSGVDDVGVDGQVNVVDGALPDGAVVLPDGSIVIPDSGPVQDGAVSPPDGNIVSADGGQGLDLGPDSGSHQDAGGDVDSGLPDLGIPDEAGELPPSCFDSEGELALCNCIITPDCSAAACATGTRCEDDGCGGRRCIAEGHPCVDASDCPAGGTCAAVGAGSVCRPPAGVCRDDRECPVGFGCEAGACVDRRVLCDNELNTCPVGYVCDYALRQGQAFCRRWDTPCTRAENCPQPGACFDIDGDGARECVPPEPECVASTCAGMGTVCGAQAQSKRYSCGPLGSCGVQTCAAPNVCVDYAGDGRPFCAPAGSCDEHSDCPAQQLCALPHLEMTPRCVGSAIGGLP